MMQICPDLRDNQLSNIHSLLLLLVVVYGTTFPSFSCKLVCPHDLFWSVNISRDCWILHLKKFLKKRWQAGYELFAFLSISSSDYVEFRLQGWNSNKHLRMKQPWKWESHAKDDRADKWELWVPKATNCHASPAL
jgi:hypothetical protein